MSAQPIVWRVRDRDLDCSARTLVMRIVNVTPDSFSDGGRFLDPDMAIAHGLRLAVDGADILDVGGESTRPGSDAVAANEEIDRILPVVKGLVAEVPDVPLSVDTRKPEVAKAALDSGVSIVNDVTAGTAPAMFDVVRDAGAGMVLMHMKGDPKTMQEAPRYDDVVAEVHEFLKERLEAAIFGGIEPERLCIDPGIGFGKTLQHNLVLMRNLDTLLDLGRPVLVGPSRKRFIGTLLDLPDDERVEGTLGAVAWLVGRGAHVVRAVRVVDAIASAVP